MSSIEIRHIALDYAVVVFGEHALVADSHEDLVAVARGFEAYLAGDEPELKKSPLVSPDPGADKSFGEVLNDALTSLRVTLNDGAVLKNVTVHGRDNRATAEPVFDRLGAQTGTRAAQDTAPVSPEDAPTGSIAVLRSPSTGRFVPAERSEAYWWIDGSAYATLDDAAEGREVIAVHSPDGA